MIASAAAGAGQVRATPRALPAEARLAARLIGLTGGQPRSVYLSQAQLGELTGVTRKTVNRLLGELVAEGVLALGRARIEVLDVPRLRTLALGVALEPSGLPVDR